VCKKEKAGTMLAYVACGGALATLNERKRKVICMLLCMCEHTLRKEGIH